MTLTPKNVELILLRGANFFANVKPPIALYLYRNIDGAECFFASYDEKGADFNCVPANKLTTVKVLWTITNGVEQDGKAWLTLRPPVDMARFPATFRERPQEVTAIQVRRDNMPEVKEYLGAGMRVMVDANGFQFGPSHLANTLHAQVGDWIIKKPVEPKNFDVVMAGFEVLDNETFRRKFVRIS